MTSVPSGLTVDVVDTSDTLPPFSADTDHFMSSRDLDWAGRTMESGSLSTVAGMPGTETGTVVPSAAV